MSITIFVSLFCCFVAFLGYVAFFIVNCVLFSYVLANILCVLAYILQRNPILCLMYGFTPFKYLQKLAKKQKMFKSLKMLTKPLCATSLLLIILTKSSLITYVYFTLIKPIIQT